MKRISSLLLAGAMIFGSMGAAHAIDMKVKGTWDFAFGWAENTNFSSTGHETRNENNGHKDDPFIAHQRIRTQVNFIASENLQGVLMFEIGTLNWGRNPGGRSYGQSSGGALDGDGVNVETKRAYLDWMVPNTDLSIRMGLQGLSLPMGTSYTNPVFSADVAAVVANYKINDMFAVSAFWARPFDAYANDGNRGRNLNDEMDMFGATLPITGDGWSVTPWGMVANVGASSGLYNYYASGADSSFNTVTGGHSAIAWWAGTGFSLTMFDPLTFGVDVMYGDLHRNDVSSSNPFTGIDSKGRPYSGLNADSIGTRGWFVTATLDYKLDWATPGLFGWWSSGDSANAKDTGKFGRMPTVGTDDGFAPTSFGFPGSAGVGTDSIVGVTGMGTWGVGIQLAQMQFIEKLEHTLRFAYYQGTNDHRIIGSGHTPPARLSAENVYLTDKDSAYEVNFDHKYQIYENLAAFLELGYIHLDMNSHTWGSHYLSDDAWKAQVLFQYKF